jgi:exonuclease SbcC
MRPIRLAMRAFGPFGGEQVVDFRELGDRTFFLIHGPTGSGKTTVLDAICYALYGDTSGKERDGSDMRSHHADPSVLTEVTFDFSLGSDVYRVARTPEQERPKKRGEGMTTDRAKATLWRLAGEPDRAGSIEAGAGTVLASRWSSVSEEIERLLGFRSEQFRQVVMLPQGQFRRLLMADSRERQQILEALFQTEIYRRIEEALKVAAKEIVEQVNELDRKRELILQQGGVTTDGELRERRNEIETELEEVRDRITTMREEEQRAQQRLEEGRHVMERMREREEAEKALRDLEEKQDEFETKKTALNRAQKAAMLVEAERALKQRINEYEETARQSAALQEELKKARVTHAEAEEKLRRERERDAEREATRRECTRLDEFTEGVKRLDQVKGELDAVRRDLLQKTQERDDARKALEDCRQRLKDEQETLRETEKIALTIEFLSAASKEADRAYQLRQQLEKLRVELTTAQEQHQKVCDRLTTAEEAYARARERLASIETAWLEGQAAVLAQHLSPGEPCPVCGSPEHPSPARHEGELPTEAAVRNVREEVSGFEAARDEIKEGQAEQEKVVVQLESNVRAVEESLEEMSEVDISVLAAKVKETKGDLARAKGAREQSVKLQEEIEAIKQQEVSAQKRVEQSESELQAAVARCERAQALVMERESGIPEGLRSLEALDRAKEQAIARETSLREALDRAEEEASRAKEELAACEAAYKAISDALSTARERTDLLSRQFDVRLVGVGFKDDADYQAAREKIEEIDQLVQDITRFEGDVQAARDRAHRAQRATEGLSVPDVEALEKVAVDAQGRLEDGLKGEATRREQLKQITGLREELDKATEEIESLEGRHAFIGRIAEVANGRNAYGITFQRFVLGALLDDVLVAASERLQIMSTGRFYLQREVERADRRTAGGLDLEVYDTYTGTTRPVSTLSGGESFLASLALALGLADVVQAYAGGIHLDAVFVDEGFGSLDPEALDLAVRALIDLQRGGRLVGIISHVPDLKERIDARLEVIPGRHGSTARFVVPWSSPPSGGRG